MAHALTGIHPKQINWEKGVFESCGKYYYLTLEAMSFAHLKRFAELLPSVIYGKSYLELSQFIHSLRVKMTTGEQSMREVHFEVATALVQWDQYAYENAGGHYESAMEDALRVAALFCVEKDEDTTVINDILIEEKVANWKKDCNIMDFFLLLPRLIPGYHQLLTTLLEMEKIKPKSQIELPVN